MKKRKEKKSGGEGGNNFTRQILMCKCVKLFRHYVQERGPVKVEHVYVY